MASRFLGQIEVIDIHVKCLSGEPIRVQVMAGKEGLKPSSKPEQVAKFIQGAMQKLDSLVDASTAAAIMSACGDECAMHNQTPILRARARSRKYASLDAFLEAEQSHPPSGMRFERDGEHVLYQ